MCGVYYSIMHTSHPDLVCLFVPSLYHLSQGTVVPWIAMVFCILPIHLKIQFLLSIASQFDFK